MRSCCRTEAAEAEEAEEDHDEGDGAAAPGANIKRFTIASAT
jgi:hypothetical protein